MLYVLQIQERTFWFSGPHVPLFMRDATPCLHFPFTFPVVFANLTYWKPTLSFVVSSLWIQLFGGKGAYSRFNFDTFLDGTMTMFVLLTTENWPAIMQHTANINGPGFALFFVIWVLFVGFIMSDLVLVIILENFQEIENQSRPASVSIHALEVER